MITLPHALGAAGLALALTMAAAPGAGAGEPRLSVPAGDLSDPVAAREFLGRLTDAAREVCAHDNLPLYVSEKACRAAAREEGFEQLSPEQRRLLRVAPERR